MNILRNDLVVCDKGNSIPFRLFEDIKKKSAEILTNDDYMKEKQLKESRAKKRDGTAPWGLGEGSVEATNSTPWCEKTKVNHSNDKLSHREIQKKISLDPMKAFLPYMKPERVSCSADSHSFDFSA